MYQPKPLPPDYRVDRGATLMLVLIATVVGFSAATGILYSSKTMTRSVFHEVSRMRARQSAEDGLRLARFLIESEPNWADELDGNLFIDADIHPDQRVQVSGTIINLGSVSWVSVPVLDAGFELAPSQLPHPLFGPPASGSNGAWEITRYGLINTGPTVPSIGIAGILSTTEGTSGGFIRFLVAVNGWGMFSQTTTESLVANSRYRLSVDVGTGALAGVLAATSASVYAGSELMAVSDDSECLTILDLGGGYSTYQVEFETEDNPPDGLLRIELSASSVVGLLSATAFDHVRFEHQPDAPMLIEIVSTGQHGSNTYTIRTRLMIDSDASGTRTRVVDWAEE
tara:strand:+ start:176770 stop:177792 length:1023 start_codon:yes stop_codon:yes gene_type:complete